MDMTENKDHIIEKKVYEDGKKEYASKGVAGTALGLGIAGTALGVLPWLTGNRGGGIFGSFGGNMPDNININTYGGMTGGNANSPTALQVMEKECADEVKLLTDMFGMKLDTANKFYAMRETDVAEKFSMWKGAVEAINAENRRSMDAEFGLYKGYRDAFDILNEKYAAKFNALDKEIAVINAVRPYQDKLLMAYTDQKCCRKLDGVLGLQSTPTVTILPSASACGCINTTSTASATTGA